MHVTDGLSLSLSLWLMTISTRGTPTPAQHTQQLLHGSRPGADPAPRRAALQLRVLLRQRGTPACLVYVERWTCLCVCGSTVERTTKRRAIHQSTNQPTTPPKPTPQTKNRIYLPIHTPPPPKNRRTAAACSSCGTSGRSSTRAAARAPATTAATPARSRRWTSRTSLGTPSGACVPRVCLGDCVMGRGMCGRL